jgi:hypothetical protein
MQTCQSKAGLLRVGSIKGLRIRCVTFHNVSHTVKYCYQRGWPGKNQPIDVLLTACRVMIILRHKATSIHVILTSNLLGFMRRKPFDER